MFRTLAFVALIVVGSYGAFIIASTASGEVSTLFTGLNAAINGVMHHGKI